MEKIILASQSPRRRELLSLAEIPFDVIVSETDESFPEGLSFEEAAMHIAVNKALAVAEKAGNERTILSADTIVVCNEQLIGKPKDRDDAVRILSMLSGNTHRVITAVCILAKGGKNVFADTTTVSFHPLTQEQITFYVDKYKPYDKAGAYAIQEWIGVIGIKEIAGDFYNVMGLPVSRVAALLSSE